MTHVPIGYCGKCYRPVPEHMLEEWIAENAGTGEFWKYMLLCEKCREFTHIIGLKVRLRRQREGERRHKPRRLKWS